MYAVPTVPSTARLRPAFINAVLGPMILIVAQATPALAFQPPDFNPQGRRPQPTRPNPTRPNPNTGTQPRRPPATSVDPEGPGTDALIKRYMGIVMSRPDEIFPLRRLADLYRQRDGNLSQLVSELQSRAAGGGAEAWSAKVALGGIHRIDNRASDAIALYREALEQKPEHLGTLRALAETVLESGDLVEARVLFERVLSKTTERVDKEAALRTLIQIGLSAKDYPAAKRYHEQLIRLTQGSIFVRSELGRELMQRGEFALAETEYRGVVTAAAGDNRALAPALKDLGQVLVRQRKNQ
ncbi:MAG: tetratricopeptide repeat protein, partial [Polyangiaceae bacterium]|nr:tetratricopeptide repeat protein [Polyangiaceae bacterium]